MTKTVTLTLDKKSDKKITVNAKLSGSTKLLKHGEGVDFKSEVGKKLITLNFVTKSGGKVDIKLGFKNAERFNGDKSIEHDAKHNEQLPFYVYVPKKQ